MRGAPDNWRMYLKSDPPKVPLCHRLRIVLDRDSVCMGDDCEAHDLALTVDGRQTLGEFCGWILREVGNLPDGYKWTLCLPAMDEKGRRKDPGDQGALAELSPGWPKASLTGPGRTLAQLVKARNNHKFMLRHSRGVQTG